jgi:hypothetical protein
MGSIIKRTGVSNRGDMRGAEVVATTALKGKQTELCAAGGATGLRCSDMNNYITCHCMCLHYTSTIEWIGNLKVLKYTMTIANDRKLCQIFG